jgi:3-hydroxybutyryl-CoA dehydratase
VKCRNISAIPTTENICHNGALDNCIDIAFEDLDEGDEATRDYQITPTAWDAFFLAFDDKNPLHTDATYARQQGFAGAVVHGGFLNGLLSHFVGMHFPGKRSILISSDIRYLQPCYVKDEIKVAAKITHRNDSKRVLELEVTLLNQTRKYTSARAKLMVGILGG